MEQYKCNIDFTNEIKKDILGVGVEWDPPMYDCTPDFTEEQWELIFKRLDFFKLKFARMMMYSPLPESGATENNYEDRRVKNVIRVLEYCQKNDVKVMLGMWNKPYWVERYDDPVWIRSIADLILYFREKGFTCIKYFNFVNEPNGSWEIPDNNWYQWKPAVTALHSEFEARGVTPETKICGPDSAYDDEWVDMCIAAIPQVIGEYEYHIYIHDKAEIVNNQLERRLNHKRWAITKNDPDGPNKRLWLGEFGCRDGKWDERTDMQDSVYDFIYGVWIADAVCQAFRAGLDGIIPWNMDDAAHTSSVDGKTDGNFKRWGFWNSYGGQTITGNAGSVDHPPEDTAIRPWYYPMSLFSRLFKQGSTVVDAGEAQGYIKVCACKNGDEYTVILVNASNEVAKVSLELYGLEGSAGKIYKYCYFDHDCPTDENGFPVVKEVLQGFPQNVELSGKGVMFLSTMS